MGSYERNIIFHVFGHSVFHGFKEIALIERKTVKFKEITLIERKTL